MPGMASISDRGGPSLDARRWAGSDMVLAAGVVPSVCCGLGELMACCSQSVPLFGVSWISWRPSYLLHCRPLGCSRPGGLVTNALMMAGMLAGRVLFSEGNSLGAALFALLVAFVILFGLLSLGG